MRKAHVARNKLNVGPRLRERPFKRREDLKHSRCPSKLRTYERRRAEYAQMRLFVCLVFVIHYKKELTDMAQQMRRDKRRPYDRVAKRRQRKRAKLLAKKARIEERMKVCMEKLAAAEKRLALHERHCRRQAKAVDGFKDGWQAVAHGTVQTREALEALSYAGRYVDAYVTAVEDRLRVEAQMLAQRMPSPASARPVLL